MIEKDYLAVESVVLKDFHIDKGKLIAKESTQAKAAAEYKDILDMMVYYTELISHIEDKELIINLKHEYNIFATGKEQISFSIKKIEAKTTELVVDYFENTNLFGFLPITIGAGTKEEQEILLILLNNLD